VTTVALATDSPLAKYAAYFARSLRGANKAAPTVEIYMRAVLGYDRFAAAHDLPRVLVKIKRDHVEQYMDDVQQNMKPASAATRYAGLRAFFSWALSTGEIRKSPLDGMRPPAVPLPDVRTVSEAQIKAMLDACKGSTFRQRRDYAIIRFLADSGCRRAEVAGLKVQDLDQTTCQAVVTGKGSKTRTVVYSAATASAIDRYMMARDDHTLASRTDALFLGPTRPLPPDAINAIVQRRAARAGVANHDGTAIHCHMLRHTFAHRSKASGMSEEQIMVLGGWRDHQTMVRYGRSEAAVRAIDAGAKVLLKVGY